MTEIQEQETKAKAVSIDLSNLLVKPDDRLEHSGLVFEVPDHTAIELLTGDSRIEYWPHKDPVSNQGVAKIRDLLGEEFLSPSEIIYRELVVTPLDDHLKQLFTNRFPIYVRGTACSINGNVSQNKTSIKDVRDIIEDKLEKGTGGSMTTRIVSDSEDIARVSAHYLFETARNLRDSLKDYPEEAKKIFPALIVYASSGQADNSQRQSNFLSASEATILKIFILDFPRDVK